MSVNADIDDVSFSVSSYAVLVFQSLLMLEFVEVLSDINIGGERDLRDEFYVAGLYAGICVFLDIVGVGAGISSLSCNAG